MAYTAKVPGFGVLEKAGARQSIKGENGGSMQPSTVPQQQPRKMSARGLKGRGGSRSSR